MSQISENKWKNFYYRKQEATQELVYFWKEKYPEEADWLQSGVESPDQEGYPFLTRVAQKFNGQTVGDRLNWAIAEWASPSGEKLFRYLSEKNPMISADEWSRVILRTAEPTIEMIAVVANFRPHFTEWIIRGTVTSDMQVDPTDKESVAAWKEFQSARWKQAARAVQRLNDNQAD